MELIDLETYLTLKPEKNPLQNRRLLITVEEGLEIFPGLEFYFGNILKIELKMFDHGSLSSMRSAGFYLAQVMKCFFSVHQLEFA